jgi:hypothetical protein
MDAQDRPPDSTADIGDGARWMTFAELAEGRRISKASAIKLVRRHGWRRQRDNKGNVIALVPLTWAQDTSQRERDGPRDNQPDDTADSSQAIVLLEAAFSALREQQEHERAALREQIDRERARADHAEQGRDADRARADELRQRLDDLTAKLTDAQAELTAAQDAAEALRQADDARKARGRLARFRAAWRGGE